MRFISAVAFLAICQAAYGQSPAPAKVQMVSMFNNFYGSLVQAQNQLLAPLAPFGRKLQQTNPFLRSQVVKGNAIGSIFYGVGFSTPGVVAEAFTGNDGTGTTGLFGRRLLQTADPYHLTSKGNVVASLLKGYNPDLSPLLQQPTFSPPLIPSSHAPIGRKLQQDNVIANYAGSVITGGVPLLDALLGKSGASYYGRKLSQFPNYLTPGRTGLFQTGSKAVQDNAIGSILNGSGSINDGVVDRKAILGFQQTQNRHLLDMTTKTNADASLLGGNVGPNTVRQSIFGYQQGRNLLQDITTKTNADASILSGNVGPNTLRQSILGYNQNRNLLQVITTKTNADASILSGNVGPNTLRQSLFGFDQERM